MQAFNAETTVATLRAFAAQNGIAVSKKANKETLIALVNAFVAEQANAEQTYAEQNGEFAFPKGSTAVALRGWSHIESGNEETAEEQEARVAAEQEAEYEQETAEEQEARLAAEHAADTAQDKRDEEKRRTLSDAIKETWTRPAVRAARLTQDKVRVTFEGNSEGFRSVWNAFEYYGLPAEKHIRFRGQLKKARVLDFTHNGEVYSFEYDAK
jgi:hypothetical protein